MLNHEDQIIFTNRFVTEITEFCKKLPYPESFVYAVLRGPDDEIIPVTLLITQKEKLLRITDFRFEIDDYGNINIIGKHSGETSVSFYSDENPVELEEQIKFSIECCMKEILYGLYIAQNRKADIEKENNLEGENV